MNYPTFAVDTRKSCKIPENPNDELNLLYLYEKLQSMAGPNQKYIYCRVAGQKKIKEFVKKGFPNTVTDPDLRIGKARVGKVRYITDILTSFLFFKYTNHSILFSFYNLSWLYVRFLILKGIPITIFGPWESIVWSISVNQTVHQLRSCLTLDIQV